MGQAELARLTSEAVFAGIQTGIGGSAWRKRKFADSIDVLMGIFGGKTGKYDGQNQTKGDGLLSILI